MGQGREVLRIDYEPAGNLYSPAIAVPFPGGKIVEVSGQLGFTMPLTPDSPKIIGDTVKAQTELALLRVKILVEKAGGTLNDLVAVHFALANLPRNKPDFDQAYSDFFLQHEVENLPTRMPSDMSPIPYLQGATPIMVVIGGRAYIGAK